ncbi:MAG: ABC transporter permease [Hyphomicrobiaceae bacterium]
MSALVELFRPYFMLAQRPWVHRHLIRVMAEREFTSRYKGSALGAAWTVLQPLAIVLLFYYVFAVIFRAKWGGTGSTGAHFIVGMFSGLLIYNVFAETVSRSVTCISGNPNYVKRIAFPIAVMPIVQLVFALLNFAVGMAILLAFGGAYGIVSLSPALLALPLALVPLIAWSLGIGWLVAALNVYFRDTFVVVPLILQALMFLSPVFYSADQQSPFVQKMLALSPLTTPIAIVRDILMGGTFVPSLELLVQTIMALIVMILGFLFFAKTRHGFADVI